MIVICLMKFSVELEGNLNQQRMENFIFSYYIMSVTNKLKSRLIKILLTRWGKPGVGLYIKLDCK